MRTVLAVAAIAASFAVANAQSTLVAPPGAAGREGGTNNAFPWAWTTSDIRTQFIYDSSVFTAQGVFSPVVITRLRFRADATPMQWTGGTFTQAVIDMSTCPVDYLVASATFDQNHGSDRLNVLTGPVVVQGGSATSIGPGPWHIDIPLGVPFTYDPRYGSDLTIDVKLSANGFIGGTVPPVDHVDVTGVFPPLVSRVWDFSTISAGGTPDWGFGPVCEFSYLVASGYAYANSFGEGCYDGASSFYEQFANNGGFDLSGTVGSANGLLLLPTGQGYAVLANPSQWFTPVSSDLGLGDDAVSAPIALPFPLVTPAGTTQTLAISSNGFIWTAPSSDDGCCVDPPSDLLQNGERFAPMWMDLSPNVAGSVHYDVDPNGTAVYVTWLGVPESFGGALNTFQVAFDASGTVEYRYQACGSLWHQPLTGYSPGGGARDPGPRDLTASTPFETRPDSLPLHLGASAPPILGQSINLTTSSIPVGATAGFVVLSLARLTPTVDLAGIGMPGCLQLITPTFSTFFLAAGSSHALPIGIPNNPNLTGLRVYGQSLAFASQQNQFGAIVSNGLEIGINVH
jgi:hypothetical protein